MTNDTFQPGENHAAPSRETASDGVPPSGPGAAARVVDRPAGATGGADAQETAGSATFTTVVDQETTINPLAEALGSGLMVSHINGVPITTTTPVDVGFAWVQLREDGWLTVAPDMGYTGRIAFDYTAAGGTANDHDSRGRVVVDVETRGDPAAVTLLNRLTAVAEDVSTASDLKVADIALAAGELDIDGLALTGLDAGMFKIVGSALYLKEGSELDFRTKPTLSVEILASRGDGLTEGASFALSVASATEAAALAATGDTLVFAPGYGETGSEYPLIDLTSTRYTTFKELMDSGALVQEGDDVVIMLNPDDPGDLQKIILKGVEMSDLSDADFKFS